MNHDNADIPNDPSMSPRLRRGDDAANNDNETSNTMGEHTMTLDEKLTTYALGELTGDDAAAIESLIARDSNARAEVEAIRAVASQLTDAMADEPAPALTDAQRELILSDSAAPRLAAPPGADQGSASPETTSVEAAADAPEAESSPVIYTFRAARWVGVALAAAAVIGLAFVWPMLTPGIAKSQRNIAMSDRAAGEALAKNELAEGRDEEYLGTKLGLETATRERQQSQDDRAFAHEGRAPEFQEAEGVRRALQQLEKDATSGGVTAADQFAQPTAQPGAANASPAVPILRLEAQSSMIPPASKQTVANGSGGRIFGDPADRAESQYNDDTEDEIRFFDGQSMRSAEGVMEYPSDWPHPLHGDVPAIGEVFRSRGVRDNSDFSREGYAPLLDNPFKKPLGEDVFSTFSIDVDTASYSNIRRIINDGALPPAGAVRIEELINYFHYDYETPSESAEAPFTVDVVATSCPWNPQHRLVRIGLKGYEIPMDNRPATNLVFLIDVSGSMDAPNKLPLVKDSLRLLVNELNGDDRVALAVYAGNSGLVLDSTQLYEKDTILQAIDSLTPGGSTHGSAGIQLAYDVAVKHYIDGGANRVILCTDGDFNVGVTSDDELIKLIEEKRKTGVFLSVLGYGTGNWQDAKMEQLSNHGNGVAAYIDTLAEARKVLVDQAAGTLVTIAKDVKIQVDFNPQKVEAYRLIGYANRMLAAQDFNDDTKDAGEIGAGHTVTALYEVVPVGVTPPIPSVDPSKYAQADGDRDRGVDASEDGAPASETAARETASENRAAGEEQVVGGGRVLESIPPMTKELLTVRLRFKKPDEDASTRFDVPLVDNGTNIDAAHPDVKFAAAVAEFGMLLRHAEHMGDASWAQVLDLAEAGRGEDKNGYRAQFIELVNKARRLAEQQE